MIPPSYPAAALIVAALLATTLACSPRRDQRQPPPPRETAATWDASNVVTWQGGRWDWGRATDIPADLVDDDLTEQLCHRESRVHANPARLFRVVWYGEDRSSHYYILESDLRTDILTGYRVEPATRRVLERIERIPT